MKMVSLDSAEEEVILVGCGCKVSMTNLQLKIFLSVN